MAAWMPKVWIKVKVNCITIGDKGVANKAGTVHGIPKAKFFIWAICLLGRDTKVSSHENIAGVTWSNRNYLLNCGFSNIAQVIQPIKICLNRHQLETIIVNHSTPKSSTILGKPHGPTSLKSIRFPCGLHASNIWSAKMVPHALGDH